MGERWGQNQKHSNTTHYTLVSSHGDGKDNLEFRIQKSELSLRRESLRRGDPSAALRMTPRPKAEVGSRRLEEITTINMFRQMIY